MSSHGTGIRPPTYPIDFLDASVLQMHTQVAWAGGARPRHLDWVQPVRVPCSPERVGVSSIAESALEHDDLVGRAAAERDESQPVIRAGDIEMATVRTGDE